ncbi:MAG: DNA helicase UvrD [Nanoarchaeota archaeon]|nr:MAG: DNA helicase UvrD [Nanoarchaeota archaeon]
MRQYIDLHIHGRYARATSKDLGIRTLEKWGKIKGLNVIGTGDFTHPKWFDEVTKLTKEDENGILTSEGGMKFIWQTEISFVYTQNGKGRRVHLVILAPNREVVEQINAEMLKRGRIDYDGRPIFGMSCIEFVDLMMGISRDIEIIPAHAWTPWFSVFGSNSGFDSLKECFAEKEKFIHSIETGMSSDPAMNWRLSQLDDITLTSNSDAHSYWPWRMGRECNVMDIKDLSYSEIINSIRTRKNFVETLEVDPGYGKYHFDGHRACNVSSSPEETRKMNGICPVCKKKLTIGVLYRVEELADRKEGFRPKGAVPFRNILPLSEVICAANGWPVAGKKTWAIFNKLIDNFGSEFSVLLDTDQKSLSEYVDETTLKAVLENREGKIKVKPGYDGQYGIPIIERKS